MDIDILLLLQNIRNGISPEFTEIMRSASFITNAELLIVLIGVIYWSINKKLGTYLLSSFVVSRVINGFLKVTFCQYRPWIKDTRIVPAEQDLENATGYSFPSGHSSNGTIFYGGLAFRKQVKFVFKILAIILIALVCFSRTYLGVHSPQDVLIGVLVGIAALIICTVIIKYLDKHPNKDMVICIIGILFCVALAMYASFKQLPIDYNSNGKVLVEPNSMIRDCFRNVGFGLGFFIGWLLERRFINFDTNCTIRIKIIRLIVCLTLFFFLLFLTTTFITKEMFGIYVLGIQNFTQTIYVVFVAPAIIKFIDNLSKKHQKKLVINK